MVKTRIVEILRDPKALYPVKSLPQRIKVCLEGLQFAWREEVSFRNQVMGFFAMVLTLALLQPSALWWGLALFGSATVLALELVNTAFEKLIDHLHPTVHPKIKIIKDILGGAVLVASMGLLCIGLFMIANTLQSDPF